MIVQPQSDGDSRSESIRQRTSVGAMETRLVSPTGRGYHLLPYERFIAARFVSSLERVAIKKGRTLRRGPTSMTLQGAAAANSLIVGPLSVAFLVTFGSQAHRLVSSSTPSWEIKVWVLGFIALVLPFWFLQFRRRIQASRESRAYRRVDAPDLNPDED
jgi:hypothetical protein